MQLTDGVIGAMLILASATYMSVMRVGTTRYTKLRCGVMVVETGAQQWPLEQDAIPKPCEAVPPGQLAMRQLPGPQQQAGSALTLASKAVLRVNENGRVLARRNTLNKIVSKRSLKA